MALCQSHADLLSSDHCQAISSFLMCSLLSSSWKWASELLILLSAFRFAIYLVRMPLNYYLRVPGSLIYGYQIRVMAIRIRSPKSKALRSLGSFGLFLTLRAVTLHSKHRPMIPATMLFIADNQFFSRNICLVFVIPRCPR